MTGRPRPHPVPVLRSAGFLLKATILGLAVAFVLGRLWPGAGEWLRGSLGVPGPQVAVAAGPAAPGSGPVSYADAVQRTAPAVVSIYADKLVTELRIPSRALQRFSGMTLGSARQLRQRAQGSGVIVSPDGYLLTNYHVVAGAQDILAVLWDGRVAQARLIGSDRDTDLAVLRVDGSELPALALDPELPVAVGDVVLAIGNPFGIGQTVTQGIVSGLGRDRLNLSTYEDFIQTDAAINGGNSGGALVNARGELIGINTAVLSRDAEGIGFAIPVATARAVLEQIVEHGIVVRGWLGAEYVDAPILPGALPPGAPRGVALGNVYEGGPADRAGLQPGDVLVEFAGEKIADQSDLRNREAAIVPGSSVQVMGLRAGLPFTAELQVAQRPQPRGLG